MNAFFAEDIRITPDTVAAMIHGLTSHLPTSEQAMQEQASVSHKGEEPKEILPQRKAGALRQQADLTSAQNASTQQNQERPDALDDQLTQEKASPSGRPRTRLAVEVFTVAAVTVLVEFLRQRRGK